jgi:hypothetical protein
MMGWQTGNQRQLFYRSNLERRIPASHLLRRINPIVMQVLADLREKLRIRLNLSVPTVATLPALPLHCALSAMISRTTATTGSLWRAGCVRGWPAPRLIDRLDPPERPMIFVNVNLPGGRPFRVWQAKEPPGTRWPAARGRDVPPHLILSSAARGG